MQVPEQWHVETVGLLALLEDRGPGGGAAQGKYPPINLHFADEAGNIGAATGEQLSGAASGGTIGGLITLRDTVVPGFTDKLDDEFSLSVGGDFTALSWRDRRYAGVPGYGRGWGQWYGDWSIWTVATANWNLYLGEKISVFPELGFTISIHDCWDRDGRDDVCVTAAPVGGVGFRYHFGTPRVAFVARINWPIGFQAGIAF